MTILLVEIHSVIWDIDLTHAVKKIVDRHFFGINNIKSFNKLTVGYIHKFEEDMYSIQYVILLC